MSDNWNNWYPKLPPEISQEEFIEWVRKKRGKGPAQTWNYIFKNGFKVPPVLVPIKLAEYIEAIRKEKGISGG